MTRRDRDWVRCEGREVEGILVIVLGIQERGSHAGGLDMVLLGD